MKTIFLSFNRDGYVGYSDRRGSVTDIEIMVEDTHEVLQNPFVFRYMFGELIKDTDYQESMREGD